MILSQLILTLIYNPVDAYTSLPNSTLLKQFLSNSNLNLEFLNIQLLGKSDFDLVSFKISNLKCILLVNL